jgi:hypothetical protein
VAARGGLKAAWSRRATASPTTTSSTRSCGGRRACSRPRSNWWAPSSSRPSCAWCCCRAIDSHWREHLAALDYLRQGIHLRGYAQKNPKQEYKREAFELFSQLLDVVKLEVTRMLMTVRIQSQDQAAQAAEALEQQASQLANVTYTHPNEDGGVAGGRPGPWRRRCPRWGATTPAPAAAARSTRTATGTCWRRQGPARCRTQEGFGQGLMPYSVVFAPEASDQLEALFLYIAKHSSLAIAERYADAVVATR